MTSSPDPLTFESATIIWSLTRADNFNSIQFNSIVLNWKKIWKRLEQKITTPLSSHRCGRCYGNGKRERERERKKWEAVVMATYTVRSTPAISNSVMAFIRCNYITWLWSYNGSSFSTHAVKDFFFLFSTANSIQLSWSLSATQESFRMRWIIIDKLRDFCWGMLTRNVDDVKLRWQIGLAMP